MCTEFHCRSGENDVVHYAEEGFCSIACMDKHLKDSDWMVGDSLKELREAIATYKNTGDKLHGQVLIRTIEAYLEKEGAK